MYTIYTHTNKHAHTPRARDPIHSHVHPHTRRTSASSSTSFSTVVPVASKITPTRWMMLSWVHAGDSRDPASAPMSPAAAGAAASSRRGEM